MDGVLATSSSSTASPSTRWTYDVFISFRGEDTRNSFVDHLYAALQRAGIYTFKDDEKLQRGKSISPELVKAIQESMVAVVVFSNNYANSSWCLEELEKIIECRDLIGQRVLPVFYDVDPSDVRGQKRSYHAAFELHEVELIDNMEKVKRWREALEAAASLSGWDVQRTASGREAECIKQIVRNILSYTVSCPVENLIGMESRVEDVKSLLGKGSSRDVCTIGIWGMGGIGKTTIARAVYHQISYEFEGSSFVEDVRENSCNKVGLKSLQEKLLSEILMEEHYKVKDCDDGIHQIRRRLGRKKVLVVLDDVDHIKQLQFLAGAHEWFGPGSRIMITTRDEHLLSCAQQKYTPELLKVTESIKLFSRYAFKADIPPKDYEKLSHVVVRHTGHLPLALKVLGSHFCGRNLDFWRSAINVLTKIPHEEINGILRLSYNGLNIFEKKIFLHIACIFKGMERGYVTRVLDSFGFEAVSGITVLIEKSLLTISNGNLHMHDLIQEMGRYIVCECYPHTIVWVPEEIKEVMTTNDRLETVEAIVETKVDAFSGRPIPLCSEDVFRAMKKLMLLHVAWQCTLHEPTYFPEQLRWLCWYLYPFQSLLINGSMAKLVGLEMQSGQMKQLQIERKIILPNLKYMDLSFSNNMTSFPDISGVPNLESLNLSNCVQLLEVHQSVLFHDRIIHLDLSNCLILKILPSCIQMKSLQTLLLKCCKSLERFPEVSRETGNLLLLDINGCDNIRALPSSIKNLTSLTILIMGKYVSNIINNPCIQTSSKHFSSHLRILYLEHNTLLQGHVVSSDPYNVWPSLEELRLRSSLMVRLPKSISQMSHLKYLNLTNCFNLKEVHELPSLIQVLRADRCGCLHKIGDLSNKYKWLFKISLRHCSKLLKDEESLIHLANMLMKSVVQKCAAVNHRLSIAVPGSKMPNWFSNYRLGNTIAVNLPQSRNTNMLGLAICCHVRSNWGNIHASLRIKFRPTGGKFSIDKQKLSHAAKHGDSVMWIGYMPIDILKNLFHGIESEDLVIRLESKLCVTECGVCVIHKDDIKPVTDIRSCIPDYDKLGRIDVNRATVEEFQYGRWSLPTFSFDTERNETTIQFE
nr:TMV resistance protein N-like isoform X1 [Tanacetum cinerariifolium]